MKYAILFSFFLGGAGPALAQGAPKPPEQEVDLQVRGRAELRELLRAQRKAAPGGLPPAQRELTPKERAELRELLRQQRKQGRRP